MADVSDLLKIRHFPFETKYSIDIHSLQLIRLEGLTVIHSLELFTFDLLQGSVSTACRKGEMLNVAYIWRGNLFYQNMYVSYGLQRAVL